MKYELQCPDLYSHVTKLRGFSTDGLIDVAAAIRGSSIVIHAGIKPGLFYFGWKPFTEASLVNAEKLPASTFKIKIQ